MNSTLRFRALFTGESLGATGCDSPKPSVTKRSAFTLKNLASSALTEAARRCDRSRFAASCPSRIGMAYDFHFYIGNFI